MTDKYSLLPSNQFGNLKKKYIIDALLTLQKNVYQAWRDKKVLLLVTFDVKGTFNGVAPHALINQFRECCILEELIYWIKDFTKNRKAFVVVYGKAISVNSLSHVGLPQFSPLSPIVYLFFHSNLIYSIINKNKRAITFIDNYTTCVISSNIARNLAMLQIMIVPHLESWA